MASAWIYQDPKQVAKHGEEKASWYVGWYNLEGRQRGKSFGPGVKGKDKAEKYRRKVEGELEGGQYREQLKMLWDAFRKEYEEKVLAGLAVRTRDATKTSLDAFERHVKPTRVLFINTAIVDEFVAKRRKDPAQKRGATVSPATINRDLRHIKAALNVAKEWNYIPSLPKFRMEKCPKKLPTYTEGEHFTAIYLACDKARFPQVQGIEAGDWWRALIVTGYMTGWRISDLLGLKRDDLDLKAGVAITRAAFNKGKRDERVNLHPTVVEHLAKLASFDAHVFPWDHDERTLYTIFAEIQEAAGIKLPCPDDREHEHTRFCYTYGFHDLRRAFATMNADKLTGDALQALMRHKSYSTTQVYINMSRQMDEAVAKLHVPDVLKKKAPG